MWSDLDTTNESFTLVPENGVDYLVITDSKGGKVKLDVVEIAKNDTFITELSENKSFIDKITNNNEFVDQIINKLKGKYGNVYYDGTNFYT
ncbi:hypothetical protein GJV76_14415, partial [Myroides sp. BIT-d1]|nr:hypothetical protein [Myroides albus]